MHYQSLPELLAAQLQEIYAAEAHLVKELEHYIKGAVSKELQVQLTNLKKEAESHQAVMEEVLKECQLGLHEVKPRVIDALIKTGSEIIQSRGDDMVRDLALVCTVRQVAVLQQGYYEDARTLVEALADFELAKCLEQHRRDKSRREQTLAVLAEDMVDTVVASGMRGRGVTGQSEKGAQL